MEEKLNKIIEEHENNLIKGSSNNLAHKTVIHFLLCL